jgi:hypothetical protein
MWKMKFERVCWANSSFFLSMEKQYLKKKTNLIYYLIYLLRSVDCKMKSKGNCDQIWVSEMFCEKMLSKKESAFIATKSKFFFYIFTNKIAKNMKTFVDVDMIKLWGFICQV